MPSLQFTHWVVGDPQLQGEAPNSSGSWIHLDLSPIGVRSWVVFAPADQLVHATDPTACARAQERVQLMSSTASGLYLRPPRCVPDGPYSRYKEPRTGKGLVPTQAQYTYFVLCSPMSDSAIVAAEQSFIHPTASVFDALQYAYRLAYCAADFGRPHQLAHTIGSDLNSLAIRELQEWWRDEARWEQFVKLVSPQFHDSGQADTHCKALRTHVGVILNYICTTRGVVEAGCIQDRLVMWPKDPRTSQSDPDTATEVVEARAWLYNQRKKCNHERYKTTVWAIMFVRYLEPLLCRLVAVSEMTSPPHKVRVVGSPRGGTSVRKLLQIARQPLNLSPEQVPSAFGERQDPGSTKKQLKL